MLVLCHCHMLLQPYYIIFRHFYWTNLLTRCLVPVPSFWLFSISENQLLEIFSQLDETLRRIFIRQKEDLDERGAGGATQGLGATPGRDLRWGRRWDPPLPPERRLGLPRRL